MKLTNGAAVTCFRTSLATRITRALAASYILLAAIVLIAVISRPAHASSVYGSIFDFSPATGTNPQCLVANADLANLYGTTWGGGLYGDGVIFILDPVLPYEYTVIHSFSGADGANPICGLYQEQPAGYYYGTTYYGGASGDGTVFKILDVAPYTFETMHSFSGADGICPVSIGHLCKARNGLLYGTTELGGLNNMGTVFTIATTPPYKLTTIYNFSGPDGAEPISGLIIGPGGELYGTTNSGGTLGCGTVYIVNISRNKLTKVHDFTGADGTSPQANLVWDNKETLYGATQFGGTSNQGTIYALNTKTMAITNLHSFNGTTDGGQPTCACLCYQPDGNYYGTTTSGGDNGLGTIFGVSPSGAFWTLLSCNSQQGAQLTGGLTSSDNGATDKDGWMFGMSASGGANGEGSVFVLIP